MRSYFFTAMLAIVAISSTVRAGDFEIDQCVSAGDKEICIGKVLNRKLDRLLGGSPGGGDVPLMRISYFDEGNCRTLWASGFLPSVLTSSTLTVAERSCGEIADGLASLSVSNVQIESVLVGSTCTNIDIPRTERSRVYADCIGRAGM